MPRSRLRSLPRLSLLRIRAERVGESGVLFDETSLPEHQKEPLGQTIVGSVTRDSSRPLRQETHTFRDLPESRRALFDKLPGRDRNRPGLRPDEGRKAVEATPEDHVPLTVPLKARPGVCSRQLAQRRDCRVLATRRSRRGVDHVLLFERLIRHLLRHSPTRGSRTTGIRCDGERSGPQSVRRDRVGRLVAQTL